MKKAMKVLQVIMNHNELQKNPQKIITKTTRKKT